MIWGPVPRDGVASQPTCKAHNSDKPSRIDFIFTNDILTPYVKRFYLRDAEHLLFDNHAVIGVQFRYYNVAVQASINIMPTSMHAILVDHFYKQHADLDTDVPFHKHKKLWDAFLLPFQAIIVVNFGKATSELDSAIAKWDTDAFWQIWCKAIESALT